MLVGADGTLGGGPAPGGGPTNTPAGIIGFSGRTGLDALSAGEQQRLGPRSSLAVGPHGAALYVGFLDPTGRGVLTPRISARR